MRVSSATAAGMVVIAVAAQGAAGLTPGAVTSLLAVPQGIVLKGGLIALIVVLKLLKKAKDGRLEKKRQRLHAAHAPNMPYALRNLQKRAVATPKDNFFLTEALAEKNDMETAMEEAVWELVEHLDQDGCLLKLLCHLQEKPQGTLTPEEGLLVGLFPAGVPGCGEEFSTCTVKEAQLAEAFSCTWQLQNTV